MSEFKCKFLINGTEWNAAHLERLAYERNLHVLHQMKRHGMEIKNGDQVLSDDDIDCLTAAKAWEVSINVRDNYPGKKVNELYRESMKRSDVMWRELAFGLDKPMKISLCEMFVEGITLQEFLSFFEAMRKDDRIGFAAHPEHFAGEITERKYQIAEPFGMYGTPTLCYVMGGDVSALGERILRDKNPEFSFSMSGRAFLMDGVTEVNCPYHQFKSTNDGFQAKLAVYWPEKTLDEIVNGHCLHLAMEFYEVLKQIRSR